MRRVAAVILAGAAVAATASATADAGVSSARVQQAARAAVAPLPAESTRCFDQTAKQRRGVKTSFCVVNVAAPAGEQCVVTVRVTTRSRPRRVSARVTAPLRCVVPQPQPGEF
jgi:hypothetical protein